MALFVRNAFLFFLAMIVSAREFAAEGSDLLMGVGAIPIAKAGAVVASDNGVYSLYWNPAGLAALQHHTVAMTGQINRPIAHVGFLGAAFVLPTDAPYGLHTVLGFSYLPRAHFHAKGVFRDKSLERTFLNVGLPGLPGGFDGEMTSRTNDYRIGFGMQWDKLPDMRIGASIGRVECKSIFSGIRTGHIGRTKADIEAHAVSIDLGAQYRLTDELSVGVVLKNIHSDLATHTIIVEDGKRQERRSHAPFIKDFAIGLDYRLSKRWQFGLVFQTLFGHYSSNEIYFKILRASATYHTQTLDYHFGFLSPLHVHVGKITGFKLPAPILPTAGISYTHGRYTIGAAFYFHPVMSLAKKAIQPALDVSFAYRF